MGRRGGGKSVLSRKVTDMTAGYELYHLVDEVDEHAARGGVIRDEGE